MRFVKSVAGMTGMMVIAATSMVQAGTITGIGSPTTVNSGNPVNISTAGTSGWAYWDDASSSAVSAYAATNTKNSNNVTISSVTNVNSGGFVRGSSGTLTDATFRFSDGVSPVSGTQQTHGVFSSSLAALNSGVSFSITLPDVNTYTIQIWVSGYEATGTFTALMAGATTYTDSSFTYDVVPTAKLYTLTVNPDSANQVLTLSYTLKAINDTGVGQSAHVMLNGVAVRAAAVPEAASLGLLGLGAATLLVSRRRA